MLMKNWGRETSSCSAPVGRCWLLPPNWILYVSVSYWQVVEILHIIDHLQKKIKRENVTFTVRASNRMPKSFIFAKLDCASSIFFVVQKETLEICSEAEMNEFLVQ